MKRILPAKRQFKYLDSIILSLGCLLIFSYLSGDKVHAAAPTITHLNPLSTTPIQGISAQAAGQSVVDDRAGKLAGKLPQLLDSQAMNNNVLSQLTPRQRKAAAKLMEQAASDLRIRVRPGVGSIRYLKVADSGKKLKKPQSPLSAGTGRDKQTAADFLQENHELLNIAEPSQEFVLIRHQIDKLGLTHLRYQQKFLGIPVWPAQANVHLDAEGNVELFEGAYIPTPTRLSIIPQVKAEEARQKAQQAVPNAASAKVSEAELIVYALDDSKPRLAWKIEVAVSAAQNWLVAVDALDGSIITAFNQVPNNNVKGSGIDLLGVKRALNVWQDGSSFYMIDTSKKMFDPTSDPLSLDSIRGGIVIMDAGHAEFDNNGSISLAYIKSTNANSWSLKDAVSASYGLSKTYDYYLSQHQRNSIDGKEGTILGFVRYGQNYENAFWSDTFMVFGDALPFAGALDVIGHEMTHGVTQHTAGLVYKDQSGALNEAVSDIFGQSVQNYSTNTVGWIMGEHLGDVTFTRDMKNPSSRNIIGTNTPYPSKMSQFFKTDGDNGGVHINSGIINHAFYMLAEGLSDAIGNKAAEKIFYRALTTHLVSNSQFVDARLACVQAAEELHGVGSAQAKAVAKAFDAVEIIDDSGTPQEPSTRPPVNGKDATLFVYLFQGRYYLGRRGDDDPQSGVGLSSVPVITRRPVISGDGSFAIFVSATNDICSIATDGSELEQCLGFAGVVHSVAMTPDGNRWAFVFLDQLGNPSPEILVIDIKANTKKSYALVAPVNDGTSGNPIAFADSMDFSGDGRTLVYDALSYINQPGSGQIPVWSMYALDLQNEIFTSLLSPIPGVAVGNPTFSQTSDSILAFEASDEQTGASAAFAANLISGAVSVVGQSSQCCMLPGYNGDDSAIIYASSNPFQTIGFSLMRQGVGNDWLTPAGNASVWMNNAYAGAIYRRGDFTTPAASLVAKPTVLAFGTKSGLKSTVTFENKGTANMSLGDAALTPAVSKFSISKDSCTGVNLVPSAHCSVEVAFAGGTGLFNGTLKMPDADTGKNLLVSLNAGIKILVSTSTLTFNLATANSDQFTVSGKLTGAEKVSLAAINSVTFSVGGFKQVLTNLTKANGLIQFKSTKAGINNLAINLLKGTFSISGSKLELGKPANPPQVSLTLNKTMDCTKPKFNAQQAAKWTFNSTTQTQTPCTALH